jgi:DNA-binding NtrC family response regulator
MSFLTHYSMDDDQCRRRQAFLGIADQDADNVRALRPVFAKMAREFAERFYQYLLAQPQTATLLRDREQLQRLKVLQADYFAGLLEANFDTAYFEGRLRVGHAHQQVGLEPVWYLGAYNQYIQLTFPLFAQAFGNDLQQVLPLLLSLVKVIFLDIGLALDTYFREAMDQVRRQNEQLQQALDLYRQTQRRERQWVEQVVYESSRYRLVGTSPAMRGVVQLIQKVAPTDATVLIHGPSGTGKELVARALHLNSPRRERPLVTINCAALQEALLESELFGHEKGAFTGATQSKPGLVEVAEGGTLFIDEIAEMAGGLQAKVLRVLEDGHFRRVGATTELHADIRVVAATNKLLEDEIKAGRFREDLYYRLNVVTIELAPLCERRQDIPDLVEHFLSTRPIGPGPHRIQPEALQALVHYHWPGNVRELANVLERAQIMAENESITLDDLPDNIVDAFPTAPRPGADPHLLRETERRHVLAVLQQEKGNKAHAARVLGISRRALYRLIDKHRLDDYRAGPGAVGD